MWMATANWVIKPALESCRFSPEHIMKKLSLLQVHVGSKDDDFIMLNIYVCGHFVLQY